MPTIASFSQLLKLSSDIFQKCSWKQRQTLGSYHQYILEEALEIEKAFQGNNAEALKEELGDLLWNIIIMAELARKEGLFDLNSVLVALHDKMVERHPHIVGTPQVAEPSKQRWDDIKKKQREERDARPFMPIIKGVAIQQSVSGTKDSARHHRLPSYDEALSWFDEYHVPKNIRAHCETVSRVATHLATLLQAKGAAIDVELVRIGALLHDWMKAVTLENIDDTRHFNYTPTEEERAAWAELRKRFAGRYEGDIGAALIKDKYPFMAYFLIQKDLASIDPFLQRTWEVKVVHYADWRVLGDQVVSLKHRFEDIGKRYSHRLAAHGPERWENIKREEQRYEQDICQAAGIIPEDLTNASTNTNHA